MELVNTEERKCHEGGQQMRVRGNGDHSGRGSLGNVAQEGRAQEGV